MKHFSLLMIITISILLTGCDKKSENEVVARSSSNNAASALELPDTGTQSSTPPVNRPSTQTPILDIVQEDTSNEGTDTTQNTTSTQNGSQDNSSQNTQNDTNTSTPTADTTPPVLTLKGDNPLYIKQNAPFTDPGITVTDDTDSNPQVSVESNVSTASEGNYTITYSAIDSAGNEANLTRTVVVSYQPFVLRVKTDNTGSSASNEFTVPVDTNYYYNYDIDCDSDGTPEASGVSGSYTCVYAQPGIYRITISGTFPTIRFYQGNNLTDASKVTEIIQWGSIIWKTMYGAFYKCDKMQLSAPDAPILYQVNSMRYMFGFASTLNADMDTWDVSMVKDLSFMFRDAASFNGRLSSWDTHNVLDMSYMFYRASSFDQPIGDWNTSRVQYMHNMFNSALLFNQPLQKWDTSRVLNMSGMFNNAQRFNQPIGGWDMAYVTDTAYMFNGAQSFDQDIGDWNMSRVTTMRSMFNSALAFNKSLAHWDTSRVTDMGYMFYNARSFDQDISGWIVTSVADMRNMFNNAQSFDQNIGLWDTSNVSNMDRMFYNARAFLEDLSAWNVSAVISHTDFAKYAPLENAPTYLPNFP